MSETKHIKVTSPLLYKGEHRDVGEVITMITEDAAACVTAGRAELLTDEEAAAERAAAEKARKAAEKAATKLEV